MKKATTNIIWVIVAAAMLGPFILTLIINAPKAIRYIMRLK